jgi:hypothetical protein
MRYLMYAPRLSTRLYKIFLYYVTTGNADFNIVNSAEHRFIEARFNSSALFVRVESDKTFF